MIYSMEDQRSNNGCSESSPGAVRIPVDVSLIDCSIDIVSGNQRKRILKPVSTTIKGGSLFAILGGSGSGKTTLLNVLAGRYSSRSFHIGGRIALHLPVEKPPNSISSSSSSSNYVSNSNGCCTEVQTNIGYVTQADYLLPYLTVRETLMFAARMKVPRPKESTAEAYKQQLVALIDEVVQDLGIRECADVMVGSSDPANPYSKRGLSGGEKRRVSIAIQIITDPRVLCADEPTSGLDSFTAVTVIEALHRLTRSHKHRTTVVASIHQPRADVFHMFDAVLLLSKGGHPVYCGDTDRMVAYFTRLGHTCPVNSNPADYFVDLSAIDCRDEQIRAESRSRVRQLIKHYAATATSAAAATTTSSTAATCVSVKPTEATFTNATATTTATATGATIKSDTATNKGDIETNSSSSISKKTGTAVVTFSSSNSSSWLVQVYFLLQRFLKNHYRDMSNLIGGVLQAAVLGITVMGIFWDLGNSQSDIESRNGLLYIVVSMEYYILMIILVERYITELKVLDRDLQDELYAPTAYLTAHLCSLAPVFILQSVVYSLPIYYGCNLRTGYDHFGMFLLVNIALAFTINGLVWMCVSLSRQFATASLLGNMSFTFISLTAGYLVNYHDIPVYVKWVKNISCLSYAYRILMSNEYTDRKLGHCDDSSSSSSSSYSSSYSSSSGSDYCNAYDGNHILDTQDIKQHDYTESWSGLLAVCAAYYCIAFLCLHFIRFPVTGVVAVSGLLEKDDDELGDDINDFSCSSSYDDERTSVHNVLQQQQQQQHQHNGSINSINNSNISSSVLLDPLLKSRGELESVELESAPNLLPLAPADSNAVNIAIRNISLYVPSSNTNSNSSDSSGSSFISSCFSSSGSGSIDTGATATAAGAGFKRILTNINADVRPGKLVALMGGSGSGKTTLLNLIAGRIPHSALRNTPAVAAATTTTTTTSAAAVASVASRVFANSSSSYSGQGLVLFNNQSVKSSNLRNIIGYVQQFDFHLPSLSVEETLLFHAHMRLPRDSSAQQRHEAVMKVVSQLGLQQCFTTRVGGDESKGISGGEKRRLSVGVQLLADPPVCLLDEPTTGLDAFTARHVMETLQQLAHRGRTVLVSIHQPRYDVYQIIDDVILLSRSQLVWAGSKQQMLQHLDALGFPCPLLTNPADFILDLSSVDFRSDDQEVKSRARLQQLVAAHDQIISSQPSHSIATSTATADQSLTIISISHSNNNNISINNNSSDSSSSGGKPLWFSFPLLLHRSALNMSRQLELSITRISQTFFYALILSCFYAPIGDDQNSVQNRIGNLYELTAICFIGMLNCIAIFPTERNVFYREYVDGDYSALAFFLCYFVIAVPFAAVAAMIVASLVCFAVGLQASWQGFLVFSGVIMCFILVGECLGVIFCAAFMHVGFSVNVMSVVLSLFSITAGFVSLDMPDFIKGLSQISPLAWGSYILANSAFRDESFTCNSSDELDDQTGDCQYNDGHDVLSLYDMDNGSGTYGTVYHAWVLVIVTAAYVFAAFVMLRWRSYRLSH